MSLPLGAKVTAEGVHFSLFSAQAETVSLCLFEESDSHEGGFREIAQHSLTVDRDGVWSIVVPEAGAGTVYGYRVDGPFSPEDGLLFNPHKLLFCPYAQAVGRTGRWHESMQVAHKDENGKSVRNETDSAPYVPLAVVVDPISLYENKRPKIPRDELVLYELHVKGMTALHPLVPEELRGTYRGLAQPAVIEYLCQLGVNAIELLPVHFHFDEPHLSAKGLSNYWGYSTLGYFAADPRYTHCSSALDTIQEFRDMVAAFHAAGIEIFLDVVFNHTCEGGAQGPCLSFRGIDNETYYRLDPKNRERYVDYTGCGNSLDTRHPRVMELVVSSLRYWVEYMGVDGFRFDLAPVLGRGRFDMDPEHGLFQIISQDRVLAETKLLAEPWDLGTYQLGHFPDPWMEWNGQFRDTLRSYWRSESGVAARLATRLAGSSDLFSNSEAGPLAGINFITCHDGFTLRDLVSYERKYNEANKEQNRDGNNENRSWNCGEEGESLAPEVLSLRLQQQKNMLMTLCIATGVPMLMAGDEISRTQKGNNNTYCQDNELSWINWRDIEAQRDLRSFVRQLLKIRRENPTLKRSAFFKGEEAKGEADLTWWAPNGEAIGPDDWSANEVKAFAALYGRGTCGQGVETSQPRRLLFCLNPSPKSTTFQIAKQVRDFPWQLLLASTEQKPTIKKGTILLQAHSAVLLQSS